MWVTYFFCLIILTAFFSSLKNVLLFQVMEFLKKMAGMENVGFSNATWVLLLKEILLPSMTVTLSVDVPTASSQREKLVTGITPLVITWKRRKWVLELHIYCLIEQSFTGNISFIIGIPAVLSWKHGDDGSSGLLLSGNFFFFNDISVNTKVESSADGILHRAKICKLRVKKSTHLFNFEFLIANNILLYAKYEVLCTEDKL